MFLFYSGGIFWTEGYADKYQGTFKILWTRSVLKAIIPMWVISQQINKLSFSSKHFDFILALKTILASIYIINI